MNKRVVTLILILFWPSGIKKKKKKKKKILIGNKNNPMGYHKVWYGILEFNVPLDTV